MGGRGASSSLRSTKVTNKTVIAYEFKSPKDKRTGFNTSNVKV